MKSIFVGLILFLIVSACGKHTKSNDILINNNVKSTYFFCDFDNDSIGSQWTIKDNLKGIEDKYEHFEPDERYGHTFDIEVPDSFQNKTLVIKVSFKYRNFSNKASAFAFTAKQKGGNQILWEGKSFLCDSAKWGVFEDSILLPANQEANTQVRLHPFNPNNISFDIDSITILLKQKEFPSFTNDIKNNINKFPIVIINNPLFQSVSLVSFINDKLEPSSFKFNEEGDIIGSNDFFDIEIKNSKEKNGVLFNGVSKFKKPTKVNRLAIIYKYKGEITEVYRNNRMASNQIYGNEIWLGKEGFKLTIDSTNWFCYGYNQLSSFQILKEQKLLIVNIDYSQDHPLFHFPELDTIINKKEDISANSYDKEDTELIHYFRATSSKKIKSIPRVLPTQHGYQSAFLWTEHADFTDFRLHKVTYYGNEKVKGPSEATAGFAFHKIPVTKSVFYTVNDTLVNNDFDALGFDSQLASIKKTPGFSNFLDSLHSIGNEICLHTPDFFTSNKETMDEALKYISQRYGSHTWIDHGYNNGHSDNREDFMCDGLNNYALDLWHKYEINYFWNGYFEDTLVQKKFKYSMSRTIPFYGFEDQLPYPIWWENKKAPEILSWRTSTVFFTNGGGSWNYGFSNKILNDFTKNYGIEFSHIYPAHTQHQDFWTYDSDSTFIIQPEFEATLQRMANLREKGLLQLPTVSQFMQHQEAINFLEYQIEGDNLTIINNGKDIKGLTLVVKKEGLPDSFYRKFPNHRENGKDLVFWFDVKEKEMIKIMF